MKQQNETNNRIAIDVQDLAYSYDGHYIFDGLNIKFEAEQITAIAGPNGAGKTTLVDCICGIKKPSRGSIYFPGTENISTGKRLAYLPQKANVDWNYPIQVLDVVKMGRLSRLNLFQSLTDKDLSKVAEALEWANIEELAERPINRLSGGEKQRVLLARAIAQDASIVVMDEPFNAVDANTEKVVFECMKRLVSNNKTVLFIHHNLAALQAHADHLILLNRGQIQEGAPADILNNYTFSTP